MKQIQVFIFSLILIALTHTVFSQRTDIGEPINEPDAIESTPSISLDGKTLIYVSDKTGIQQYYQSSIKPDGTWAKPVGIDSVNMLCKAGSRLGASSLSFDGNTLYFCAVFEGGYGDMDIYMSKRKGKTWGAPINLGNIINTSTYEGTPSISLDEKTLYFAKDNPGFVTKGFLCKKIYVSHKDSAGNWQKPIPLPAPVNLDCEQSPRICSDNRTLFFSSVRAGGKGKADLYMTKILAKNTYSGAVPMDFTNTEEGDMYASVLASGEKLYYSISGNESSEDAYGGIFIVDIPEQFRPYHSITLHGQVRDSLTGKPLKADIIVSDANTTLEEFRISSNEVDGNYTLVLAEGKNYSIDFSAKNYSHQFASYNLKHLNKNRTEEKNIGLFSGINLELNIYDADLYIPLTADISILDSETGQKTKIETDIKRMPTGRYNLSLPIGGNYKIKITKENYSSASFNFDLSSIIQFNRFVKNSELSPVRQEHEFSLCDLGIQIGETIEIVSKNKDNNETLITKVTKVKDGYIIQKNEDEPYKTDECNYKENYIKGNRYDITVSPKGYFFYNTVLDMSEDNTKTDLRLKPILKDTKLTLKNITFESNSAELSASSYIELNRVIKLMTDNKGIKIEISAHTDDVGSETYNLKLSNRRATSVVNYLIEHNISNSDLIAKGYGESAPLVPNISDENRALNRRVELKIIDVL